MDSSTIVTVLCPYWVDQRERTFVFIVHPTCAYSRIDGRRHQITTLEMIIYSVYLQGVSYMHGDAECAQPTVIHILSDWNDLGGWLGTNYQCNTCS